MKNSTSSKNQNHEDLRKDISLLASAFESVTEAIIVIDLSNKVFTFNQKFIELWGIPTEEVAIADASSLIERLSTLLVNPLVFRTEIGNCLNQSENTEQTVWELIDGRFCEISCQPQFIDGRRVGSVWCCRDITVRKKALDELSKNEAFLRAILENLNDSIVACDADGNLTRFDHVASGIDPSGDVPSPEDWAERFELYHPDGKSLMKLEDIPLYRALHEGRIRNVEMATRSAEGKMLIMVTNGQALIDKDNNKLGAVVVMHDITERKKTEDALCENEYKLRRLLESMSEGLLEVNTEEEIVFANERFCEMTGYENDELIGKVTLDLFFGDAERRLIDEANVLRRQGITGHYELALRRKSGEMMHVMVGGTPILDAAGNYTGTMGVFTDITERKQSEERLLHDAFHDDLTGLANRALFMEHLEMTIKSGKRGKKNLFAVFFLDFDRFKVINDSLGHAAGDKLLKDIAERLQSSLRPADLVARLGGDEFAVLLNNLASEQSAFLVAERLKEDLKLPFNLSGREIFLSASIGIAFGSPEAKPEEMLRDADIAMYRAKSQGIACFQVFDKEMHKLAMRRLQLETELRQALELLEFRVFYQPIVDIQTLEISSFEALIRWQHPTRGIVSPFEFIPAAEENNMILAIGKWMLHESCRQLRQWQKEIPAAYGLQISVNLSVKEFLQADLVEQIVLTLKDTGLDANCLKLEITESHVMENSDTAVAMMDSLRDHGIELSLDDFGTGYSSLSYLHRLPVSTLKIDRSFVNRMMESRENREIVNTILRLAHNLKMKVVAEGIETSEQLGQLQDLGCEYGQGYFFSKPLNSSDAATLIRGSKPTEKHIVLATGETLNVESLM